MTPGWTMPWLVVALLVLGFVVLAAMSYRRRQFYEQFRNNRAWKDRTFTLHGPPITPELQQLFGAYGQGKVTGIVQLRDGLQVGYDSGLQLTFVPVPSGGKVGGKRE